ncbi:MAG: phosphoribosylglycinamide formyltransferase [Limnoraphis robusta]|uniref:Phosphoribosylglycinamide formyltransferase n=2 Tax=Limnoraphis robusta TaxID=1118279 RepID=A0A0F5YB40_9CYAN|nr:phosphoribosylglycinamide formyltransferase [Limnoraphis robusta]KKD36094.1 phosphoribosylglycinamide formyltransferase [Limnoraphis robusta CS-951]MEA5497251.1 phosphoribosylglycinamide formyltransferase [Limnoraphis robusta BA-68 BA1]MEA5519669.1 phosphoribosylglycinamide formyltransferase [Limnoraphis robusta CCNP1315]MEA5540136.1 phosphoribosylglycinamide formyltransferase [Limnoraphis robusta Tam1]MEA5544837.1 phosphoribosylglycinamide formyltransferase [Limnoraphis robusta CCNP1324]
MSSDSTCLDPTPSLISPEISPSGMFQGSPLKLGILASGSGSNFAAIAQAIADHKLNAQVQVLIYNNPEAKVVERANKFGVTSILLNHRHYSSREKLDEDIVKTFKQYEVDWVVMAGWMRIVTPVLIDAFPQKIINLHPSLLPSFPGIRAIEQALEAGVKITGCTVHLVELKVDSGPILMQAAVPILPHDTPETLHARIQVQEHQIIVGAIAQLQRSQSEQ